MSAFFQFLCGSQSYFATSDLGRICTNIYVTKTQQKCEQETELLF